MKQIKVDDKEFNFATQWEDLTLKQYFEFIKLTSKQSEFQLQEEYAIRIFEVLSNSKEGDLYDASFNDLAPIAEEVAFVNTKPVWNNSQVITHNGINYVIRKGLKDLNDLTTGEYITIKQTGANFKDPLDMVPYILAVLIRPGQLKVDNHGLEYWEQDKFDKRDVNLLEYRKDLILNNFKAVDVMGASDFFLSGNPGLMSNLKNLMLEKQVPTI